MCLRWQMDLRIKFSAVSAIAGGLAAFFWYRALRYFQVGDQDGPVNQQYLLSLYGALFNGNQPGVAFVQGPMLPITEPNIMVMFSVEAVALGLTAALCGYLAKKAGEPSHLYAAPLLFSCLITIVAGRLLWMVH